jgi:hypothetical protein
MLLVGGMEIPQLGFKYFSWRFNVVDVQGLVVISNYVAAALIS